MTRDARPGPLAVWQRIGPEQVAAFLVVVVVAVVVSLVVRQTFRSDGTAETPAASAAASAAASIRPTASGDPAAPTPLAWQADAVALVAVDRRLIVARDALRTILDTEPSRAEPLVDAVREINVDLRTALEIVDRAVRRGLDPDLQVRLQALHAEALELGTTVLGASVTNVEAYVAGSSQLVTRLEGLEALITETEQRAAL